MAKTSEAQLRATMKWKSNNAERYKESQRVRTNERYHNDEEYREKKKAREREYYKKKVEAKKALALAQDNNNIVEDFI